MTAERPIYGYALPKRLTPTRWFAQQHANWWDAALVAAIEADPLCTIKFVRVYHA